MGQHHRPGAWTRARWRKRLTSQPYRVPVVLGVLFSILVAVAGIWVAGSIQAGASPAAAQSLVVPPGDIFATTTTDPMPTTAAPVDMPMVLAPAAEVANGPVSSPPRIEVVPSPIVPAPPAVQAAPKPAPAPAPAPAPKPKAKAAPAPAAPPPKAQPPSPPPPGPLGDRIVAAARTFLGIPYLYGGITRAGLDCSGLTSLVLRSVGLSPPRTADQQLDWSIRISRADARAGDLVFGMSSPTHAHHVGIYLGNGEMIDAPNSGSVVGVHKLYRDDTVFGRVPA